MRKIYALLGLILAGFATRAQICSTTISTFPHIENFENATTGSPGTFPTGWNMTSTSTSTTPYRWQVNAGPTGSTPTGPNVDHTTGVASGKYVYTEASFGTTGDVTILTTPCFNLTGLTTPGMEFWYHMAGPGIVALDVEISSNNGTTWTPLTTITGSQQAGETDPWLKRTVSFAGQTGTVMLRFKGTLGPPAGSSAFSFEGDIAVDDVKIFNIPANDLELVAITAPISGGCGFTANENVTISIKNTGGATAANFPVSYKIGTNATVTETTALSIAPGATSSYTFSTKADLSIVGTYTFVATALLPGDGDPSNDSKTKVVTVIPTVATFPYIQDFESGAGGWTSGGNNSTWVLGTPAKPVINAAASGANAWVTGLTGNYNASENSFVLGPCFNMSSLALPIITLKIWWNSEFSWDGAVLQSSIDGGTTWQNVGAMGDPDNWYTDNTVNGAPGGQPALTAEAWTGRASTTNGSNGYVNAKHNLTGLGGQSSVLLRIAFGSDPSVQDDGFAFDDIAIFESPANDVELVAITSPVGSGCGFTANENVTVTIKNLGSAPATSFPVNYQLGTNPPIASETFTGTIAPGATAPFTFATKLNLGTVGTYSLTANTMLAGDGNPTNNSKSKTITVVPTIATFPYFQNFESGAGGWVAGGTSSSWVLGTPAKPVINSAASGTNAWVTGLTGNYNASENSYVLGPCFNMSTLVQPLISMKIWWNSEFSWDGAVLQSSIDGGTTWQKVGAMGDPNNWYTDNTVNGAPGGQPALTAEAWTGRASTNNGSNGWVIAKHALTGLGAQSSVQLRIAFGSDPSVQDDGFAFDDVAIFESPANDVGVIALTSPILNGCGFSATEQVCVTVTNFGSVATTTVPISYQIGTNAAVNENITTPIAPGATATFCFATTANLSAGGNYNFTITSTLANDGDPSNNSITRLVTNPLIAAFPYTENFESSTAGSPGVLPTGWTMGGGTGGFPYRWEIETDQPSSGTGSGPAADHTTGVAGTGKYIYTESSNGITGDITYLYSPCINLSGLSTPGFEFWYHMHGATTGSLEAEVSTNGGTTWTSLTTITGAQQTAATDPWLKRVVSLASYTGTVRIRFKATRGSSFTSDMAIDDVRFYNIGAVDLGITSFTPLTKVCGFGNNEPVQVSIDNFGGLTATGFTMSYTLNGGTPVTQTFTGNLAPNSPTTFTFTQGADLSAPGQYIIVVTITGNGDPNSTNDTVTYTIGNATFTSMPPAFDFETVNSGIGAMRTITASKSTITESTVASNGLLSTKGMLMSGVTNANWQLPVGPIDPWTNNLTHLAGAYICFNPSGGASTDSLWLTFDLKQLFKTANANTNFRVTVNGQQIGATYRPPFGGGTAVWKPIKIDLTAYKNLANIQIGLESSVAEEYAGGQGTANMVDNVKVARRLVNSLKDDQLNGQLSVYPNPSAGLFTIGLPKGKTYQLQVTDMTGKVIKTQNGVNGENVLNLNGTAIGIYLLKVSSANGMAVRKLIID